MTEREAIAKLAELVGDIAHRCWEQLGTAEVGRIMGECAEIREAMSEP